MDRVREALFSILCDSFEGGNVLDLFAGTGSLGLEAMSRGASAAHFVERNRVVVDALLTNIERTGSDNCTVYAAPVERILRRLAGSGLLFDLVFLDPPYRKGLVEKTIGQLVRTGLVSATGRIVAEHEARLAPPVEIGHFFRTDNRKYGDTAVSFYSPLPDEDA